MKNTKYTFWIGKIPVGYIFSCIVAIGLLIALIFWTIGIILCNDLFYKSIIVLINTLCITGFWGLIYDKYEERIQKEEQQKYEIELQKAKEIKKQLKEEERKKEAAARKKYWDDFYEKTETYEIFIDGIKVEKDNVNFSFYNIVVDDKNKKILMAGK